MGLFGSGPSDEVQDLIDAARGDSVTADKLAEASAGVGKWDRLNDAPLIDYLREDEQPHYIISQQQKSGIRVTNGEDIDPDGKYRTMMTVTDQRVLFTAGGKNGDTVASVSLDDITEVETRKSTGGHGPDRVSVTVNTADGSYTFGRIMTGAVVNIGGAASDEDEVQGAVDYISEQANATVGETVNNPKSVEKANQHISESESAEYVTTERVEKISEVLDDDETVHYLTRGSTVDVEGSSAGESLFGDDRSRKSGTKGYVRTAITDKRVVVKVPQWLGNDERSVPYENITSVDLDTGLVNKRISLQTPGQTYHIEAHEPGKDLVRDAIRFIREQSTQSNEETVVVEGQSEPDPTEQLKNLKELHDQGVLSDEEFEDKKQSLLEKL